MKKLFILLFVATFVLFTSCEKEEEPYSLALDMQNGYWENSGSVALKFDGTNQTQYNICDYDV